MVRRGDLLYRACAMIIVHKHPSGDPEPSAADLAMTPEIAAACKALDPSFTAPIYANLFAD